MAGSASCQVPTLLPEDSHHCAWSPVPAQCSRWEQKVWFPKKTPDISRFGFVWIQNEPKAQNFSRRRFFSGMGGLDATPRRREFLGMLTSRYSSCCSVPRPRPRPAMGAEVLMER